MTDSFPHDAVGVGVAIYKRHAAGCCLHIALDDGNWRDEHLDYCADLARERNHSDCLYLAETLRAMTKTRRRKVAYRIHAKEYAHD